MRMSPTIAIAFRALRRNGLQTSLTIVGMTIGVAAVLAMIAIGTGAEAAIEDQIRAAGMNLIVVTAGNYKVKAVDDFGGGAVEPSAALRPSAPASVLNALSSFISPTLHPHPQHAPIDKPHPPTPPPPPRPPAP